MTSHRRIAPMALLMVGLLAAGCAGSGGPVYSLDNTKGVDCSSYTPTVEITEVSPATGGTAGGETITVTGVGFDVCTDPNATLVYIGEKTATRVKVTSDIKLTCVTPPGPAGKATVSVQLTTVVNRESVTATFDGFTYR